MDEKKELKVLRVGVTHHQMAKVNAAKRRVKIQEYIEFLIQADEEGRLEWPENT